MEQRGKRVIQNREPVARSGEQKQSTAVTMRVDEDNHQQLNLRQEKNGRAKQNVSTISSSGIGFSGNVVMQPDLTSQQLMTEIDDRNIEHVVCTESNGTNVQKKQSKGWTLDIEYGISRDVLEQHSKKKLEDVAEILGVSRSTLKRICRKHDISRWPPRKAKKSKCALTEQEHVQHTTENVKESTQRNKPLQEKCSVPNAQTRTYAAEVLDNNSIMVKATYKDDIIKFQLSVSSRKLDLEEEVATRLRLPVGSFKIKYLDEEDDWVLISCDTDLRICISTFQKLGNTTIKILELPEHQRGDAMSSMPYEAYTRELPEHLREDAVHSIVYETDARVRDPVYGCVGAIFALQQQINCLQTQLALAQAEVVHMRMRQLSSVSSAGTATNSPDHNNITSSPNSSSYTRSHHHDHRPLDTEESLWSY